MYQLFWSVNSSRASDHQRMANLALCLSGQAELKIEGWSVVLAFCLKVVILHSASLYAAGPNHPYRLLTCLYRHRFPEEFSLCLLSGVLSQQLPPVLWWLSAVIYCHEGPWLSDTLASSPHRFVLMHDCYCL